MLLYAAIWAGLFAVSAGTTLVVGPNILAFGIFPIPVALYMARRRPWHSIGLIACAGGAAFVAMVGRSAIAALLPLGETVLPGERFTTVTLQTIISKIITTTL